MTTSQRTPLAAKPNVLSAEWPHHFRNDPAVQMISDLPVEDAKRHTIEMDAAEGTWLSCLFYCMPETELPVGGGRVHVMDQQMWPLCATLAVSPRDAQPALGKGVMCWNQPVSVPHSLLALLQWDCQKPCFSLARLP